MEPFDLIGQGRSGLRELRRSRRVLLDRIAHRPRGIEHSSRALVKLLGGFCDDFRARRLQNDCVVDLLDELVPA